MVRLPRPMTSLQAQPRRCGCRSLGVPAVDPTRRPPTSTRPGEQNPMRLHLVRAAAAVALVTTAGVLVAPVSPTAAAAPPITVSPAAAAPGSTVTVSGSGCTPGVLTNLLDRVIVTVPGALPV